MRISLDFENYVVDNVVYCIGMWNERCEDGGQRWRHGSAHYEEGLRNDTESALPEIGHVSCMTEIIVISICDEMNTRELTVQ